MRLSLPITDRIQDARWPWCAPFWTAYYVRCYVGTKNKGLHRCKPLIYMVPAPGVEPGTY